MAKRLSLEEKLAALNELRDDPTADHATVQLRKSLESRSGFLAAKAAQIIGEFELDGFGALLVDAFACFMADAAADKGCKAKTAIAEALQCTGCDRDDLFLRGVRHVQMEPVYGGKVDTAAELRGTCAFGLVRMNCPHLLADPEHAVRIAAARAISGCGQELPAVPLLRFKVLSGDEDPQVLCECFGALLKLAPDSSLKFVADTLGAGDPRTGEAAALALGESRRHEALEILKQWWQQSQDAAGHRTTLLAIAMLRHDQAFAFLLSLISDESAPVSRDAIAALGIYKYGRKLRQRVEDCVARRSDVNLGPVVANTFEQNG